MQDEKFVLKFLEEFLSKQGHSDYNCYLNKNDPPDITVTLNNNALLGVEVTRVYQQVKDIDGKSYVSSEKIYQLLYRFGEVLKKKTENLRKHKYVLELGTTGYRPIDKKWEIETAKLICQHIVSEKNCRLEGPGFWLSPPRTGNNLYVTVNSSGPHNIDRAITATLRCSLESKERGIQRWNGNFFERWLLLLNCYQMIDDNDFTQVEKVVRQYATNYRDLTWFNGIMWSGFPNRTLKPIFLSKK